MQNFSILNMNQDRVNRVIRVNRVKIELIYYAEFMQNFSILNMNQDRVNRVIRVNRVKIELIYYAEFRHESK